MLANILSLMLAMLLVSVLIYFSLALIWFKPTVGNEIEQLDKCVVETLSIQIASTIQDMSGRSHRIIMERVLADREEDDGVKLYNLQQWRNQLPDYVADFHARVRNEELSEGKNVFSLDKRRE